MGTMKTKGVQLQVRGLGQVKQGLKMSVALGKPQMQEMVETVFTPPHLNSFEALLNEPFGPACASAQKPTVSPARKLVAAL
jgi:hypothetical protein